MKSWRGLAAFMLLVSSAASSQSYTCPDKPTWKAVPCSMHKAIQETDGKQHSLIFQGQETYYRQYTVTADASTAELHIYQYHFRDSDWVARQVAKAWAAQPIALRKATMPLVIGVDAGDGDSPVHLDYTNHPLRAHVVEFPASYVHEYAKTLDWSFEELLTHEMCHVLDAKGGRLSERSDWRRAVRKDGAFVSNYASASNREDFAESCAAFFLARVGGRLTFKHRLHLTKTMARRTDYFDRMFAQKEAVARKSGN